MDWQIERWMEVLESEWTDKLTEGLPLNGLMGHGKTDGLIDERKKRYMDERIDRRTDG